MTNVSRKEMNCLMSSVFLKIQDKKQPNHVKLMKLREIFDMEKSKIYGELFNDIIDIIRHVDYMSQKKNSVFCSIVYDTKPNNNFLHLIGKSNLIYTVDSIHFHKVENDPFKENNIIETKEFILLSRNDFQNILDRNEFLNEKYLSLKKDYDTIVSKEEENNCSLEQKVDPV